MNVLVACEESQRVCIEFRRKGHNAFSCDVMECSGGHPEWHIRGDVLPLLNGRCSFTTMDGTEHRIDGKWDMIIAFPPCTYLSKAGGNRLRINGEIQTERFQKGTDAANFFRKFLAADCPKIVVENPVPLKIFQLPQYDQIIQPFMFGDPWQKTTCLWLRGVPPLFATEIVIPESKWVNSTDHRKNPKKDKWQTAGKKSQKERSKTFPGIAKAMAEQWG